MPINGCDCSIVIKTRNMEFDVPYSDETLREAVSVLEENASIEGEGICRAIRKKSGVKGCVVTSLTIGSAPLLLYLAMGAVGRPLLVSETKNLFKYDLNLVPVEDTDSFDLIQDRGNGRFILACCRVIGFELRFLRDEAVKLKLDIASEYPLAQCHELEMSGAVSGERFNSNNVTYKINGREYKNIYGLTIISKKIGGTKTEIWIKRTLENENEIPFDIEELVITASLLRDKYEYRYFGTFRITIKRLVLISDETEVNATGAVISPLRFYVTGGVQAEVFTSGEELIA